MSNRGTIHIDQALTNFSLKHSNGALIADLIMPRIDVAKDSDAYFVYGRQDFRTTQDLRAEKADTNFVDSWKIESTPTYRCEERALADLVSDRERRNADAPLAPDFDVAENLSNMLMLNREKRVADTLCDTATFALSGNFIELTGAQRWNDPAFDSDSKANAIESRIDGAKEAVRSCIGRDPNVIVIPAAVAKSVKRDPAVRELIKYTDNTLLINGDLPPTLWNLRVLIPGSVFDASEEGQPFEAADVWGGHVLVAYVAPNPRTPRTMTLGLTFQSQPRQVAKWREDGRKSDAVEVSEILVEKVVSEYCGYLIKDAIAL
jgi:hypothetical protein